MRVCLPNGVQRANKATCIDTYSISSPLLLLLCDFFLLHLKNFITLPEVVCGVVFFFFFF